MHYIWPGHTRGTPILPSGLKFLPLWQARPKLLSMSQILSRRQHLQTPHRGRDSRYRSPGSSLGLPSQRTDDLIDEVRKGLPFKTLESLSLESGLSVPELATFLEIPERTLARRKVAGRLGRDESERLLRLSRIFEKAVELFNGDVTEAVGWLRRPRKALADKTPLFYAATEVGAREVENLIGQLEHGVFP